MNARLLHRRSPLRGMSWVTASQQRVGPSLSLVKSAGIAAFLAAALGARPSAAQAPAPRPATAPGAAAAPVTQVTAPAGTAPAGTAPAGTAPGDSAAPGSPSNAARPKVGGLAEPPESATQTEFEKRLAVMLAGSGLTADEVAKRAVQNSYAIIAKHRSLEAVEASVSQAQAEFWPQLLLQARYTRLSDVSNGGLAGNGSLVVTPAPADPLNALVPGTPLFAANFSFPVVLNNYSLEASLTVPLSDYVLRTSNAVGAAKHSRASAELDEQATRLSVAREGRVTYYEWVRALGQQIVTSQSVALSQGRLQDTQNTFTAGVTSRADVLRSEAGVKQAQLLDERAKHALVIAALRLRVLMRDETRTEYEVGENLLAELPELDQVPTEAAAYQEAIAKRPELKVLQESEASLTAQASVSSAANYPRLEAKGNAIYANPNQRYFPAEEAWKGSWDVGLVLSWTPTDIPGAAASSSVVEARAAEVAAQRGALEDSLKIEVSDAIESVKEARFALDVTQAGLRAAEESYRVRRELFRAGRSTLVELTDAESDLTRARIESVNARVNSRLALVALNYALGRDSLR